MDIESVERVETSDGIIYKVNFSGDGKSIEITFKIWEEDGDTWISFDNPKVRIDGKNYVMTRALRNYDYDVLGFAQDILNVYFYDIPYSDGLRLNGGFSLLPTNTELY